MTPATWSAAGSTAAAGGGAPGAGGSRAIWWSPLVLGAGAVIRAFLSGVVGVSAGRPSWSATRTGPGAVALGVLAGHARAALTIHVVDERGSAGAAAPRP